MTLHVLPELAQRTDAWYAQRRGMVTASAVGRMITVRKLGALDFDCPACGAQKNGPCLSKRGAEPAPIKTLHPERTAVSATNKTIIVEPARNDESRGLAAQLVAERISDLTEPTYVSDDMWRGLEIEPIARDLYSKHFAPVKEVGFMVNDDHGFKIGYSPDGLIGNDGLIEIKSRRGKKHVQTVLAQTVPIENMAQIQCGLLVSGREWCDYISYCGGMHLYPIRVKPDPRWQKAIVEAVRQFEFNASEMVAQYLDTVEGLPMTEPLDLEMRVA